MSTNTIQRYKPFPPLTELAPGYEAGWKFDVLILQALPEDKVGSILLSEDTKADEAGASTVALIVDISPTAFRHEDWFSIMGGAMPYERGDVVLTRRYPPGLRIKGADGRDYMMVKDEEIVGKRCETMWTQAKEVAA